MLHKKRRYLVALSSILLAGMLAIALVSYSVSKSSIRTQLVDSTLPLVGDTIYSEIQRDLLRPVFIASLMASNTFVHDWVSGGENNIEQMNNYLSAIKNDYNAFTAFFVSDKTNRYYHPDGILKQVSKNNQRDIWYYETKSSNDPYLINIDTDLANNDELAVFVNYRVVDENGLFIGAIGVGLAIDSLTTLIAEYGESFGRTIYFTNDKGFTQLDHSGYASTENIINSKGMSTIAQEILSKTDESAYEYSGESGTVFVNARFIEELGWYLIVEQRESQWLTPVSNALFTNFLVSLVLALVVLALAFRVFLPYQSNLEKIATSDKLTGALNRQAFESITDDAFRHTARKSDGICLLLIDIDHFKSINDTYGHAVGDQALVTIVQSITTGVRESDVVCRWGGEEFCVLLQNTDIHDGAKVAEHIRTSIMSHPLNLGQDTQIPFTASIGAAERQPGDDLNTVMRNADDALYLAKRQGRNQVVVVGETNDASKGLLKISGLKA